MAIEPSTPTAVLWRVDQAVVATVVTLFGAPMPVAKVPSWGSMTPPRHLALYRPAVTTVPIQSKRRVKMWYRVRTADGLVGWVPAEHLAVGE
ncbi:MAG: hypothetical protein R2867_42015 [Caldilineaceae bacterium]